jgi:hypothetical protein
MKMERFVIARHCNGGIGDHLACLLGAWWIAKRTKRVLVVDWRGSRFNPDKTFDRNCFLNFFQPRSKLAGVDLLADDAVPLIEYPRPIWPNKWSAEALRSHKHLSHTPEEVSAVNSLITAKDEPGAPTIVLNQWVHPLPPREALVEMIKELEPAQTIADSADRYWQENIGSSKAIAIHVRHGNGENIGARAAYWLKPRPLARQLLANALNDVHRPGIHGRFQDNMPESLIDGSDDVERFCRRVARTFRRFSLQTGLPAAVPLLFTDAHAVIEGARRNLPHLAIPAKTMQARGKGPLHQTNQGVVSEVTTHEMFIDLALMNRCDGLIFMDSGFSILSRLRLPESHQLRIRPSYLNRLILRAFSSS